MPHQRAAQTVQTMDHVRHRVLLCRSARRL